MAASKKTANSTANNNTGPAANPAANPAASPAASPIVAEAVKAARGNLDAFAAQVEKTSGFFYEQTVKAQALAEKNGEQTGDLIKGQFAAVAASQLAFAKGIMDLTQLGFEQLQETVAQVETTAEQLLATTSVQEAGALQTRFVQAEYDRACGNAQRLADVAVHVADDVTAPLREQAASALEDARAKLVA